MNIEHFQNSKGKIRKIAIQIKISLPGKLFASRKMVFFFNKGGRSRSSTSYVIAQMLKR